MESENHSKKKFKRNVLIIALISFSVVIIVLFPVMVTFAGNLMIELAKNRQKARSTDLSGIAKAIQIYSNDYNQYPKTNARMICGSNMTGLGKAMLFYVNEFDQYPTPEKWCDLLMEKCQVKTKIFRCPGAKEGPCNYALNKYINEMGTTNNPDIVVFFETHPGWNQVGGPEILTTDNHEGRGCNVVFLDGHVKFVETKDIPKLKWKSD